MDPGVTSATSEDEGSEESYRRMDQEDSHVGESAQGSNQSSIVTNQEVCNVT